MDSKNIFNFFYPILDSLNRGSLIRGVMAFLFRLIGVVSFVGGVYFFFKTISYAPDFWFVLLLFLFAAASFISLQIWFYRANVILKSEDSEFTAIPIFSNLFRAIGENYALFLITVGIGGTFMLWFSNYGGFLWALSRYIPFVEIRYSFIGGVLFLAFTIIIAFLILLISYFLAENILVLVQIAKNTHGIKEKNVDEKIEL